jgi:hypothetical protein
MAFSTVLIDMKKKHLVIPTLCGLLSMGVVTASAAKSDQIDVRKELQSVVIPEMPVKAVELVKKASSSTKAAVALSVIQESAALNPASLISVVSEIAKAEPKLAGDVAVFAATLQPSQLSAITHAVIKSAPNKQKSIVLALAQAFPMDMPKMAAAAHLALPADQGADVFATIIEAYPGLKPALTPGTEVSNLDILRQMLANNPITVTVSILETSLQVVATQVVAIQNSLRAQLTKSAAEGGGGLSPTAVNAALNFSAIAKKILEGKISIPSNNPTQAELDIINGQINSELEAEITEATVLTEAEVIKEQNPGISDEDLRTQSVAAATPKVEGVKTSASEADPSGDVLQDPKFVTAKDTASQSTALVGAGQTVTLTDDTIREYSNP